MYDVIIVGGSCAGLSAAMTARMRNMEVLVLYAGDGSMGKIKQMDNYPGMPNVSGEELLRIFRKQAEDLGVISKKQLVQKILPMGKSFSVLAENDLYEAKSIILALGIARVSPLTGEEELLGQGVSYCATCDGMFYRGKQMLVVAGGIEAVEEANYLSELGQVTYIIEKAHDTAALAPGIKVIKEKPLAIHSIDNMRMMLKTDQNEHEADGIFVLRPAVAMTQLLPEVIAQKGAVLADDNLMTNIPGVFAAGDILGAPWQAPKSVGDGNVAALAAASYLRTLK
ncbi:MAG: NAD(P)/FAD-dependent oxidoreductase [Clostridiales bacterium]|nr:NAD(P)/FAD-dependent oxidoreductase [Clostridiales bacterium]